MQFGCCTNMLPRTGASVGEEYLEPLAKLGYDYAELPLGDICKKSPQEFKELVSLCKGTIPVGSCNNFFPAEIKLCGPKRNAAQIREYTQRALERVAALGAPIAVLGSPWSKSCPDGFPREEASSQLVETCCEVGDIARPLGITIALEPNNQTETNMINTYQDVLTLAKAADHPAIRCLQDYFHLKMEHDTVDSMVSGSAFLVHTHFARLEGRRFPKAAAEDAYYAVFFRALAKIGYHARMSMEGYLASPEDFAADAAATLHFFHEMEAQTQQSV